VTALHGSRDSDLFDPANKRSSFRLFSSPANTSESQLFRFVLAPDPYVATGIYDGEGRIPQMSFDVVVPPIAATLHEDLRSFCK